MNGNSGRVIGDISDEICVHKEVTWKIPTRGIKPNFINHDLQSQPFAFAGATWILHLYPFGSTVSGSVGNIQFDIERLNSNVSQHYVCYKSYFITHGGKKFSPRYVCYNFDAGNNLGWLFYVEKEHYFLDEKIITAKDVLTFKCRMISPKSRVAEASSQTELIEPVVQISKQKSSPAPTSLPESNVSSKKISGGEHETSQSTPKNSLKKSSGEEHEASASTHKDSVKEISGEEHKTSASTNKDSSKKRSGEEDETSSSTRKCLEDCDCVSSPPVPLSVNKMILDFEELYLKKEDCDIIVTVKGEDFPAHRSILIARSPVFACIFKSDMKEKSTGIVEVEDCDPSSFSDFLCFLYSGKTGNITTENVFSLFYAADKYDVRDLKSQCLEFMKKTLSVDSFCDTFTVAFQHSEKDLIEFIADFFAKNCEQIFPTIQWQSFVAQYPTQCNELFIKALKSKK